MANVPTTAFDPTTPAGSTQINQGDDKQREWKVQVQEIISVDHKMESSGQGSDWGQHKQVTLQEKADLGTGAVDATILGSQTVSGKGELVYTDEDDNDVQLTSGGSINAAALKAGVVATVALDNLDTVAINTSLISDTDNTDDLGSSGKFWKRLYIKGSLFAGASELTQTILSYLLGLTSNVQDQLDAKQPEPYSGSQAGAVLNTTYNFTHGLGGIPSRFEAYVDNGTNRYPCQNNDTNNNGATITATATQLTIKGTGWFATYNGTSITSGTLTVFAWA